MLSVGKMHSRAKSRSCENYLCIKVKLLNMLNLLYYVFFFFLFGEVSSLPLCVCLFTCFSSALSANVNLQPFSAEPCVVIVHVKGMMFCLGWKAGDILALSPVAKT